MESDGRRSLTHYFVPHRSKDGSLLPSDCLSIKDPICISLTDETLTLFNNATIAFQTWLPVISRTSYLSHKHNNQELAEELSDRIFSCQ